MSHNSKYALTTIFGTSYDYSPISYLWAESRNFPWGRLGPVRFRLKIKYIALANQYLHNYNQTNFADIHAGYAVCVRGSNQETVIRLSSLILCYFNEFFKHRGLQADNVKFSHPTVHWASKFHIRYETKYKLI